jgi:uncharacterized protein YtpQ (UPF0354 family)
MSSRFTRIFYKTDEDQLRSLQARVAAILAEKYPDSAVTRSRDPRVIEFDGRTCGLTNIYSAFLLTGLTDADLRVIVNTQFDVLTAAEALVDRDELECDGVRSKLMPQLMPAEFLEKIQLVSCEFGDEVVLGFVIDTEKAYSYVSVEDARRWGVSTEDLREIAFQNLDERSQGIEILAFPTPNGFVVINTLDGFDAVRILSPKMHEFIKGIIGAPFRFGVPNRDFLICWEKNDDLDHQTKFTGQISQDFDERPYPLSRNVFEVSADGTISQVNTPEQDPKAASSRYN